MMNRIALHFETIGWGASVLLHSAVLFLGGYFVVIQPQFAVDAGRTSTEVELVADSTPPPQLPPPEPVPETPPPPVQPPPDEMVEPVKAPVPEAPPTPAPQPVSKPIKTEKIKHTQTAQQSSSAARGSESAQPDYLRNPPPAYPEGSRQAHEEGVVMVLVTVSASGIPIEVTLQQSSNHTRLDEAALRAVRKWKFHPASVGGIAIQSQVSFPVRFELH